MANEIGMQKSINGTSIQLNNQKGEGAVKPMASGGNPNPGDSKPPKPECKGVPNAMDKK